MGDPANARRFAGYGQQPPRLCLKTQYLASSGSFAPRATSGSIAQSANRSASSSLPEAKAVRSRANGSLFRQSLADCGRSLPPPDEPDPASETDCSPSRTQAGQGQGHASAQKSLLLESLLDHHLGTGNGGD